MLKKDYFKTHRIQTLIIVFLSTVIIYQFVSLKYDSNAVRLQQTDKFAYSLTNLAATEASRYLSQEKSNELQFLIDSLSQVPVVKDATIYDRYGKIIYQSEQALALTTLLKIKSEDDDGEIIEAEGVIPYITELYSNKTKIGYIRITLEKDDILSLILDYEKRGLAILQLLIFLSFITGMIVTAIFFKRAEIKYNDFKMQSPYITQRIKKRVQELIKKAQE